MKEDYIPVASKPTIDPTYIRSMHHHAFRSGEWAEILTVAPSPEGDCYVVRFPDGRTDYWVVNDPVAQYEFASPFPDSASARP